MKTNGQSEVAAAGQAEIVPLSSRRIVRIAWRGIKVRIWRSMLVVSGIVLAIAFLSYIVCSDGFVRHVVDRGSPELIERLTRTGVLDLDGMADQRVQTLWMVGLALLISFVGIINAMLMSVTERFREIGTMKCLGALDSFVMSLFLLESLFEGAVGSIVGLGLGVSLGYLEGAALYGGEVWGLMPGAQLSAMLLGCFAAGLVLTVLGALYPAYQAARMTPVMALRSEV